MAAGKRAAAGPRSPVAMAQWKKKKGLRKRRGAVSQAHGSDSEDGEFEIQAEDDARARKRGPGQPLPSFPTSECTSDVELDTREMVRAQNKKKKKSGGFQSMGLSYLVFKGIMKKGYKVPTPIQRKTIPVILDGKDTVAMARTGSGKTACFLIPMFERLKTRSAQTGARALILSPTRELALQTMKFTKELGRFTGLKTALILGGDKMEDQFAALHENPDIIIATPGRLVHVAVEMNLKLHSVEYVVFDEADRLFEMGFAEQLQEIISRLPGGHQTVLFSATLPKLLVEFARAGLTEPVLIRLDVDAKLNEQLKTSFFLVREDTKAAVLLHLLRTVVRPQDQTVVFVATKHHAEYLQELLSTQRVSCTHIYSALDQTARKINLARFTHGKCSTLIVTDLAARGLDIPLLDNVINYSFPAKGKLFLHRVGRVARAGRSGTAYSLVSPDEVPYLLDLHLFVGRTLSLAPPNQEPTGAGSVDGVLGRVPQSVVDDEDGGLRAALEVSLELRSLGRVADNAQQQYVRSRPAPSPESIKRAKELDLVALGLHPLFSSGFEEEELQRLRLVDSIRQYRSRATIFEISASSQDLSSQVMRAKRQKDHRAITRFQQGRQERQEGPAGPAPACPTLQEEPPEKEEDAAESMEDVFTEVVGQKRPRPGPDGGAKRRREEARQRDQEFYIPYRPKDFDSERGLSVGSAAGAFEQQVAGAVLDLMGDESQNLTRGQQQLKWDRKKKRFVGQAGQDDKKKIKTESGRYISSSYRRDLYQKWKQKQKIDGRDSEEEGPSDRGGPPRRGGKRGRGQGASQPRAPSTPTGRVRSELKTKQQILKQRRRAQKLRFLQRGGLKQLSARNRRRAQELRLGAFGRGAPSRKGKMRKRM
ncbi:ATP-dependent RNA helicase DDX54 [Heterocephalus glaber]|uniref:ATP-dependent RNA helicase DDX54 n=1 Tax=Heterocephalus glaber TaxID=10181 RepID=G5AKW4_HETGA|nr:ATP-dependent RNA helicase DDX54 isoform X3 [Heterocephalus glaber]EHA97657.1 ATP-dependent RNA helicase DDX54 [Heterocephalus glaber]